MKKKIVLVSILAVLMLVSATTAAPNVQTKDLEKLMEPELEEQILEPSHFNEERIKRLIENCWNAYNNYEDDEGKTLPDRLQDAKDDLYAELDKPGMEAIKAYIKDELDSVFKYEEGEPGSLYERLDTLKVNNLWHDIQNLFGFPGTNTEDPEDSSLLPHVKELLDIWAESGFEDDLDDVFSIYPFITLFCAVVSFLSLLWNYYIMVHFPVGAPGGRDGALCCILFTAVVFAPIVVTLGTYLAVQECFRCEPDYKQYIKDIYKEEGVLVATLMLIGKICSECDEGGRYIVAGWGYVTLLLCIAYIPQYGTQHERGEIEFGNTAPHIADMNYPATLRVGQFGTFEFDLRDVDVYQYGDFQPHDRDLLQVGFDWDMDKVVHEDDWHRLEYLDQDTAVFKMRFQEPGVEKFYVAVRDIWGVESEYKLVTVGVSKSNNDLNLHSQSNILVGKLLNVFSSAKMEPSSAPAMS